MANNEQGQGGNNKHQFKIIVNGREKEVHDANLTFNQVIALAFDTPPSGENVIFTITYRKGKPPTVEGTLIEGQNVHIQDGTVFNVTATDKS
jgi:hypothetical protein